ncbi:hypothetical protein FG570_024510, partial [Salmonella enterica subsp. enterica serovar Weltevreden]
FPVNAWPDWSALSALSKSKGWDMCHSFLIVYYWNDTEFLTLPKIMEEINQTLFTEIMENILLKKELSSLMSAYWR